MTNKENSQDKKTVSKNLSELRDLFWDAINKGDYAKAEAHVHTALAMSVSHKLEAKKLHFKGLEQYMNRAYSHAEDLLKKASMLEPRDLEIKEDWATSLDILNQPTEALRMFEDVFAEYNKRDLKPTSRCLTRLATEAINNERFLEAEQYFNLIEKQEPESPLLLNNRLVLYWHYYLLCKKSDQSKRNYYIKEMENCIQGLKKVTRDWEKDYSMLNNFGVILYLKKKYKESIEYLKKAIDLNKEIGLAHFNLGLSLYRLDDLEEALSKFSTAMEKLKKENIYPSQKNAELWHKIAEYSLKRRKEPQAVREKESFFDFLTEFVQELDNAENFITKRHTSIIEHQEYLLRPRTIDKNDLTLTVLRGFHLASPQLPGNGGRFTEYGGGYFLNLKGTGMAIDPGFNFLSNLYKYGYSILDLDVIIITTSYLDHTSDLESLLTLYDDINLLVEQCGRDPELVPPILRGKIPKTPKKLKLYLSQDSSNKFISWLSFFGERCIDEVNILSPGEEFLLDHGNFRIEPIRNKPSAKRRFAFPVGLILKLSDHNEKLTQIGYTSDTIWYDDLKRKYQGCDLIVAHIGPIHETEFDMSKPFETASDHLGILGCYELIQETHPRLFLISDMGKELEIRRAKVIENFNLRFWDATSEMQKKTKCVSCDLGMLINLKNLSIKPASYLDEIPVDQVDEHYVVEDHVYSYK